MNTVREVTEMPMYELTGAELDAVSGGFFDFGNTVFQLNAIGAQIGLAIGAVTQVIQQGNNSNI
jgi:hypothetical protein